MTEYKITEGVTGKLNKVTPKALKALKAKGLYAIAETDVLEPLKKIMEMLIDESQLFELMDIILTYDREKIKVPDEVDLGEVLSAYRDFFGQLQQRMS